MPSSQCYLDSGFMKVFVKNQVRMVWLLTIMRALESANNFDGLEYIDICIKVSVLIPILRLFGKFGNFSLISISK